MIWTVLPRGAHPHGAPDFEWLYRTPAHPGGISQIRVANLSQEEQDRLAEYWFRLNFVPFEADGPWFTLDASLLGGPDLLAPEHEPPLVFLEQEFFGTLSAETIADLATRFLHEAAEWSPIPFETPAPSPDDPATTARVALERVQADLERVGPGHNQGPILDPEIVAEIREQVRLGLNAVAVADAGSDAGKSAAGGLLTLTGTIGAAFTQGVAKKAGEDAEPLIKHGFAVLLDHMLQAASALLHWIASIPAGPFL